MASKPLMILLFHPLSVKSCLYLNTSQLYTIYKDGNHLPVAANT